MLRRNSVVTARRLCFVLVLGRAKSTRQQPALIIAIVAVGQVHALSRLNERERASGSIGERIAEVFVLLAHDFIGHANATRRKHFSTSSTMRKLERKPEIQPSGIADYFRWEAMAAIKRGPGGRRAGRHHPLGGSNSLT